MARRLPFRILDELPFSFTSMIDVVFLLLIFFLLQPIRQEEKRLPSELPKIGPGPTPLEPPPTLRIRILRHPTDPSGALYAIAPAAPVAEGEALVQRLAETARRNARTPVALAPDPRVHFRHVLHALDRCALVGLSDIRFESPAPAAP